MIIPNPRDVKYNSCSQVVYNFVEKFVYVDTFKNNVTREIHTKRLEKVRSLQAAAIREKLHGNGKV